MPRSAFGPNQTDSEFCKCVLGTHVVWIRIFPGTGILESTKIISVLSYRLIGLVEISGIEFLPLD